MDRNRVQKRMDEKSKVKVQVKSEENQEPNKEIFRDRPGPARVPRTLGVVRAAEEEE